MTTRRAKFLLNGINARIDQMDDEAQQKVAEQKIERQREDERIRLQQRQREEERALAQKRQNEQQLRLQKQSNTREERQDFDKNRQNQRTPRRVMLRTRINQRVYS